LEDKLAKGKAKFGAVDQAAIESFGIVREQESVAS
jgi:hypothetical protein